MSPDDFCAFCLRLPDTEETVPFGPDVLVYKVRGKMFALIGMDEFPYRVNLKCDPDYAVELRDQYEEVQPGYHMNKKHWNTVQLSGRLPRPLLEKLIHHSYDLVLAGLPKKRGGKEKKT